MKVIWLTATAGNELSQTEEFYLKDQLKFEIIDSCIKATAADAISPQEKSIESFFGPELDSIGRILFCEQAEFDQLT